MFVAPLIHDDWAHLAANTLPFAVLGFLVMIGGALRAALSTLWSVVTSGLFAWLLSPPNTVTIGASGLIFGWLTYLLTRGLFARNGKQILLAVVIFVVYGGILWGVFPTQVGISWQAHLGGAIGGVLAARWLHARDRRRRCALTHGRLTITAFATSLRPRGQASATGDSQVHGSGTAPAPGIVDTSTTCCPHDPEEPAMFDVFGLPLHPLVVHAVVVLLPLSALGLIACVAVRTGGAVATPA